MEPAVRVRELTKTFGDVRALDAVTLDVARGSLFGLLGPNGAGKTTLFSVAAGFLLPTSGSIEVLGRDVRRISELRGRFAMLPQDASLQRDVPVIDQLTMFGRLHGWTSDVARDRGLSALNFVGLADVATRSAGALSHGMTKRVAVAQTLLGDPDVLLLDEPTAGLDPDNARAMRQLIKRLHGETRTVIISSHDLNEIQDLCDTVAILQHGRLVETAAMESLVHTGRLFRFRLPSALTPMISDALSQVPGVLKVTVEGDRDVSVHLDAEGGGDLDSILGGIYGILGHHRLWPRRVEEGARLEARFLEITGADP